METVRDDAIVGFNTFLENRKTVLSKAKLAVVLCDDRYEVTVDAVAAGKVQLFTRKIFGPRGDTAFFDAIGRATIDLKPASLETGVQAAAPGAVVCILADGQEQTGM